MGRNYETLDAEDEAKISLYDLALSELKNEDQRYGSNWSMWWKWSNPMKLWWIEQIEAQARAGHNTVGVAVVSRAVEIRLRG